MEPTWPCRRKPPIVNLATSDYLLELTWLLANHSAQVVNLYDINLKPKMGRPMRWRVGDEANEMGERNHI